VPAAGTLSTARRGGVIGTTILAAGGLANTGYLNDMESYDPIGNDWSTLSAAPVAGQGGCTASIGGSLLVAGGNNGAAVYATTMSYSPTSGWQTLGTPMPQAVTLAAAAAVGGKLYCIGGATNGPSIGDTAIDAVQIYQP
jgi:N-acetylneuraminic acid mutarotase